MIERFEQFLQRIHVPRVAVAVTRMSGIKSLNEMVQSYLRNKTTRECPALVSEGDA